MNTNSPSSEAQNRPREVAKLSWLFPAQPRWFRGQPWVYVVLRTLHLIGVAGLGAGFLYPAADETWRAYYLVTMLSGGLLTLLFIWSNGAWLLQLAGQAILLKHVLIGLFPVWPGARAPLFLAVVVISGLIAHAPKQVRHFSLFRRGRQERFGDRAVKSMREREPRMNANGRE